MDAAQGSATGDEGIGGSPERPRLLGRLTVFGNLQLKGCHEPSPAPPATPGSRMLPVDSEAAIPDELAVGPIMSGFGQSGARSYRDEPSLSPPTTPPAVDPEAAAGELSMEPEHVMSGFGRLPTTPPAVDPEAAAGEQSMEPEHVMSGFGRSGTLRFRSIGPSPSPLHQTSDPSAQPMSMAHSRSSARARFLKKVGRTESEETQLDADCSLAVHDEELLRAVPASAILGCSGWALMGGSQGCEATFSLSRPVPCMNYFVSHSWKTPAWLKMVCLMYEMNVGRAVVAAVATQIVMGVLQTAGLWNVSVLPTVVFHFVGDQRIRVVFLQAHWVISSIVFFLVLRWGQALPVSESLCFLDKCCINQTDSNKKEAGILQLGAFLRNSEYLLVLWQPEYFTRLWCIYELAAFSHVNRNSCARVLIRPLKVPVCAVGYCVGFLCWFLSYAYLLSCTMLSSQHAEWIVRTTQGAEQQLVYYFLGHFMCMSIINLLPCLLMWTCGKWHMNDLRALLQQLSTFRLADTKCQVPDDRHFVLEQITEWFGSADEFEIYVRSTLHSRVETLLQDQGPVPYGTVLVLSLSGFLLDSSGFLAALNHGDTEYMWRWFFASVTEPFACFILIQVPLRLAETSLAEDFQRRPFFKRMLAGPAPLLAMTSMVPSISLSILHPLVPLWYGPVLFVAAAAATALCSRRGSRCRASAPVPP